MDGNKKITGIAIAGIIALAITACKVHQPGYVSLYVDNLTVVNDTPDPGEAQLNMADSAINLLVKPMSAIEAELPDLLRPAEQISKISFDSAYQHNVERKLNALNDSVQKLRYQMIELQKQLRVMPDSGFAVEKPQKFLPVDSLQPEFELKQLNQENNDTIIMLPYRVTILNKAAVLTADTVYISEESVSQPGEDSLQTDYKNTQLLQAKNDSIAFWRHQLNELQNNSSIKTDTVFLYKESPRLPVAESRQTDPFTSQLIQSKDQQIQMLQNQLNAMQYRADRTPQPTIIAREPSQIQPLRSQQTDQSTLQLFQTQNDTIQFLKSQIRNLQLQPYKGDSVHIEKEATEMQPVKELVAEQKTPDLFQALQDTLQLLKTRVISLEEKTLPGKDTVLTRRDENDAPYKAKTDTVRIVASYERGGIKPSEEQSVLKQIKELCNNKNVTGITLSGYTDSSGSAVINKEITNRRLNYLSDIIATWIAKEKIFFQNFGDTFASDTIVSDERRIEITIVIL